MKEETKDDRIISFIANIIKLVLLMFALRFVWNTILMFPPITLWESLVMGWVVRALFK
jgi:hypothetical protein